MRERHSPRFFSVSNLVLRMSTWYEQCNLVAQRSWRVRPGRMIQNDENFWALVRASQSGKVS
jgi:hypothetical protein